MRYYFSPRMTKYV